jgi:hypothetical protein
MPGGASASLARTVLRLSAGQGSRTDALPRRLLATGVGERNPIQPASSRPRAGARPAAKEVRLRSPRLPKFLDEVILRNLQVGDSSVDIAVRRHGENVSLSVLKTQGVIEVSVFLS